MEPPSFYNSWLLKLIIDQHNVTPFPELYGLAGSHWGLDDVSESQFEAAFAEVAAHIHHSPCSVVYIDGKPVGTHPSAFDLVWDLREKRRCAVGLYTPQTSISHSHEYQAVYITTNGGRALQPLLTVDPTTQRVRLQRQHLTKSIHWLTQNGYIEFLDEQEVETLTIALTVGDLYHWQTKGGPFTHIVPHPSICYSMCSNWGCFQPHTMSARNVVQEQPSSFRGRDGCSVAG